YIIYRLDSDVKKPDYSDAETLSAIKGYISSNKIDDITQYVDKAVAIANEKAKSDFAGAAKAVNATVIELKNVNNNIASSQFLTGLNYHDKTGMLATAASDENTDRELFTSDEGFVTAALPVQGSENTYVVAKVTGIDKNNESASYAISLMYKYYAMQQPALDRFNNVITSNKHVDNFYNQFFATLFSSAT
ncbi:MAG: hypothetical protein ACSW74_02560, partial [Spirochaetales bacterium]